MRLAITFFLTYLSLRGDTLKEILDRMDADAVQFKGVRANLTRIDYNLVFKDKTEETAVLTLMKEKKGVAALLEFSSPDPKQYLFRDTQLQEFLPKLNLINEYDLGKSAQAVNQFVTLGFGASGKELQKNYTVAHHGSEVLRIADKEIKVTRLELVPRSPDAVKMMKRIEFWIPEGKSYAVQLKIHQPSGDTNTAIYTSVQLNPPGLNEHSIELKTPKNVKHEKINN